MPTRDFAESEPSVFATRNGMVETELAGLQHPIKADGIIAIKIRDDDELLAVPRRSPTTRSSCVLQGRADRALRGVRRALDGCATPRGVRGMDVGRRTR